MPPPPCDQPASGTAGDAATQGEPHPQPSVAFELVLVAQPAALSVIRDRLRRWFSTHHWPDDEVNDLVLAVSEAAANALEHAYPPGAPGDIEIDGRINDLPGGSRQVGLTVVDHGRWRPIPEEPENRRRGIPLMRAVVAELVIHGTDQGTTVMMRSRCVG
jgi:serine/threonine-protein kinase RsbW